MSGSLRPINLGVPDITVVVRENSDANKVLVDVPNISVNIEKSPDYKVSVQPSSVVVQRTGSLPLLAVSALNANTASYALAVSGSIDTAVSSSYALTASYAQNAGAGSGFPFSGSAVITGSLLLVNDANVGGITGSLLGTASVADAIDIIFAGEFQTGSDAPIVLQVGGTGNVVSASYALTGSYAANAGASVSASYASTASYISALSGGARGYIPLWSSDTTISSSGLLYQTASNLILGDGTTFFDETNPDKLGIYAGRTNSFNLVSAHANNDNYLQINIRNFSTGSNSSADIVATYDTGTEDTGYIDMGINGTSYVGTAIHDLPGDGYLFTTGSNLVVGTGTPNSTLSLFAGGENYNDGKLRLKANNQHQLTGSLNISGSQNILGNTTITGSVTVSGSLQANIFTLPTSEPLSPQTGSVYFSGSFIYVYTGTQYRSASLL